ncbi:hypothetical protein KEJ39_08965 [Candidatus Bathyarchaeota archaeon]|nr:hypothetical protein [Candidatus Bathyarchaeota archaeon]
MIVLLAGFTQIVGASAAPWTDYRNQVESVLRSLDALNERLNIIHMNYAEEKILPEDAVAQVDALSPRFQEVAGRAEGLTPPPKWERYHWSFIEVVGLNLESVEELREYFSSGDESSLERSLSLIRRAVGQARQLGALIPQDEESPVISGVLRNPTIPTAQESVELTVNVTDLQTGLGKVAVNYTVNNGDWTFRSLQLTSGSDWNGTWTGTIPGQPSGSTVKYEIIAVDRGGNIARSQLQSYTLWDPSGYIPIVLVAVLVALSVAIYLRSRRGKQEAETDSSSEFDDTRIKPRPSGKLCDESGDSSDQN